MKKFIFNRDYYDKNLYIYFIIEDKNDDENFR